MFTKNGGGEEEPILSWNREFGNTYIYKMAPIAIIVVQAELVKKYVLSF